MGKLSFPLSHNTLWCPNNVTFLRFLNYSLKTLKAGVSCPFPQKEPRRLYFSTFHTAWQAPRRMGLFSSMPLTTSSINYWKSGLRFAWSWERPVRICHVSANRRFCTVAMVIAVTHTSWRRFTLLTMQFLGPFCKLENCRWFNIVSLIKRHQNSCFQTRSSLPHVSWHHRHLSGKKRSVKTHRAQ